MSEDWQKEVKRNMDTLLDGAGERELTFIYNEIRKRLRVVYEKRTPITWKICDRCHWSFPRLIMNCQNCGGDLREFEVSLDDRFKGIDLWHASDQKA